MSKDKVIDALSEIDDDIIKEVATLREKRKRGAWYRGLAACVALIAIVGVCVAGYLGSTTPSLVYGIYVDNKQYMPAEDLLTQTAGKENVGEFLGYVSLGINTKKTHIRAYNYIPEDGKTNRVIVCYNGNYYVYEFSIFRPDGNEDWPKNLLKDVEQIEVREAENGGETLKTLSAADEIAELLSIVLNLEKKSEREINQWYYDLYKDHFGKDEVWFDEDTGSIKYASIAISVKFTNLINKNDRHLVFVMADKTRIVMPYQPQSRVLCCYDFGFILTDEQVTQINRLIGLE